MSQFIQYLDMGGYSLYVWPAYGIVCTVLLLNILFAKRKKKRTYQQLQQWFKS